MKLLPVALNVAGKSTLVVGGGSVAARKVRSLLECEARVTVVAPQLCDDLASLQLSLKYFPRLFQSGDCAGFALVFACTNDSATNAAIAAEAARENIWCNVADDAARSDFHGAAAVRRGDICIGITTTGGSPALSRHLKTQIEKSVAPEYEQLLEIMSARRATLEEKYFTQRERAAIWRAILDSEILSLLQRGERAKAEALADEMIEPK